MRKNGTYKTVPIKAGKKDFDLDKNTYAIGKYFIGRIFGITVLRAFYVEGFPLPIDMERVGEQLSYLKIDSKAIKNMTNKKILNVFGEAEFTRLELIVIMGVFASIVIGILNFILLLNVSKAIGA